MWVHSLPADMSFVVVRCAGPDVEKIMVAYREGLTAQREMLVIAVCFPPRLRIARHDTRFRVLNYDTNLAAGDHDHHS